MPDPNDTSGQVYQAPEPPKPNRDSILIDIAKSTFDCTRSKEVKEFEKDVKLFGSKMSIKMDNVAFSANTKLDIKNAYWFMLDKQFECGKIILDMKRAKNDIIQESKEFKGNLSTDVNGKVICVNTAPECMNLYLNYAGIKYKEHDPLSVKSKEATNLMQKMKKILKKKINAKIGEEKFLKDEKEKADLGHTYISDKPLAA